MSRAQGASDGYLTILEVAELARTEHKSVRRAIHAGQLAAFEGPKRWLIREADARAWIESRPVQPVQPVAANSPRRTERPSRRAEPAGSVTALQAMEQRGAS